MKRRTLIALNVLVVMAMTVFFAVPVIADPRRMWGPSDSVLFAVSVSPCVAALIALRERATPVARSVAARSNAVGAGILVLLGLGASTGIGGFVGLLVFIVPALVVLSVNWVTLRHRDGALDV